MVVKRREEASVAIQEESREVERPASGARWEKVVAGLLIVLAPFVLFYNLELNPRPWHDEGTALSVPKTLVEDGVYASRNVDEFQTFGAVQSVGPTVLVPIALVFKFFGVGVTQGRVVVALYALVTLYLFYRAGAHLFGRRAALVSVVCLLASPAAGFVLYSRQVLGETPAVGFLLGSWLVWARGFDSERWWRPWASGLLLGAALVTKSQYVVLAGATIFLLLVLDRFYYRLKQTVPLLIIGAVAVACVALWNGWQIAYFGTATYFENMAKLRELGQTTLGFRPRMIVASMRYLAGTGAGHLYHFWGPVALVYVGLLGTSRTSKGLSLAYLWLFTVLWLAYFLFWNMPWPRYVFPAAVLLALFVGKLYDDVLGAVLATARSQLPRSPFSREDFTHLTPAALTSVGALVAVVTMGLLTLFYLQRTIRDDVVDRFRQPTDNVVTPHQLQAPREIARFLRDHVEAGAIIETWDRELSVLTPHRYHAPDQSLLGEADKTIYLGAPNNYALGAEYFDRVRPAYVVVGFYSRFNRIYDADYLSHHTNLVATFGTGEWRYDVMKVRSPSQ